MLPSRGTLGRYFATERPRRTTAGRLRSGFDLRLRVGPGWMPLDVRKLVEDSIRRRVDLDLERERHVPPPSLEWADLKVLKSTLTERSNLAFHPALRLQHPALFLQSRLGGRMPRNSQSPPSAVETTSSDSLGCPPTSSRTGTAPSTIVLRSVPRPSTSTSTTSPGFTGRELAGVPERITSPGSS